MPGTEQSAANKAVLDLPLGGSFKRGLCVVVHGSVHLCVRPWTVEWEEEGRGRKDRFKEVLIEIFICSFSTWFLDG